MLLGIRDSKGRFIKGQRYGNNTGRTCFKKGHKGFLTHPNKTSFQKGMIPWCASKKGTYSMKHEGQFKKGKAPWNKGIPNLQGRGKNCHFWKGGITPTQQAIRTSLQYEEWRREVFERDLYTCQICFEIGGKLNADHIKRFSDYPELRFDINNGQTLCEYCHLIKTSQENKEYWIKKNAIQGMIRG